MWKENMFDDNIFVPIIEGIFGIQISLSHQKAKLQAHFLLIFKMGLTFLLITTWWTLGSIATTYGQCFLFLPSFHLLWQRGCISRTAVCYPSVFIVCFFVVCIKKKKSYCWYSLNSWKFIIQTIFLLRELILFVVF